MFLNLVYATIVDVYLNTVFTKTCVIVGIVNIVCAFTPSEEVSKFLWNNNFCVIEKILVAVIEKTLVGIIDKIYEEFIAKSFNSCNCSRQGENTLSK